MENRSTAIPIPKVGSGGFINQDAIIKQLGLREGMVVADLGCGAGYFTVPMARALQNTGKIYAVDVLSSALEAVLSQAKLYGIMNLETVRANVEVVGGTKIPEQKCDLVVLANILFQCGDRDSVLLEAKRILRPQGRIAVIDWVPSNAALGPKYENCFSEADAKKLAITNGLKAVAEIAAGTTHYGFILESV